MNQKLYWTTLKTLLLLFLAPQYEYMLDVSIKVAAELVHYEGISESSPKNIC